MSLKDGSKFSFAFATGEERAVLSHRTQQNRDLWQARRKKHSVACYKCGELSSVRLGKLSGSHAQYERLGTAHEGNHFCCHKCIKLGIDEVRQASINTASDTKLREAIKILRKAGKIKAAKLLESKLNKKEAAK